MDVMPVLTPPTGQSAEPELESLSGRVKRGDKAAIPALARQFESVFMAQLVKEMRQTLEPGTLFGNDPGDVFGGMFDLFLGKHLAKSGGIGLASMLERYLGGADQPRTATAKSARWEPKPQNSLNPA
jgi:peptidoglycan hydrolase FlgJ